VRPLVLVPYTAMANVEVEKLKLRMLDNEDEP
jgi:hypothetical protein